jgi:hypothetical protein
MSWRRGVQSLTPSLVLLKLSALLGLLETL